MTKDDQLLLKNSVRFDRPSEQQDDETSLLQQIQNQKDMIANSDNSQASIYDQDAYNKIFRNLKENDSSKFP